MTGVQPFGDPPRWRGEQRAQISLELPSEQYVDSFFQAMDEFRAEGIPQTADSVGREQFPAFVLQLHDQAAGRNLKEGYIPSKEFWMIDADGYAGRIILGLAFTPTNERVGHHVGYAVRPSRRQKGYASEALRLLLDEAKKLGIYELMPACGVANVASRKVIEKNGGVLLNPDADHSGYEGELRYFIDLNGVD